MFILVIHVDYGEHLPGVRNFEDDDVDNVDPVEHCPVGRNREK